MQGGHKWPNSEGSENDVPKLSVSWPCWVLPEESVHSLGAPSWVAELHLL